MKKSNLKWLPIVGLLITVLILILFPGSTIAALSPHDYRTQTKTDELFAKKILPFWAYQTASLPNLLTPTPSPVATPTPASSSTEETLRPIPAYSPQAEALREATLLLGEGDRLKEAGQIEEAREKWLAAAEAYQRAGDGLGESDAYLRLADSYNYSLVALLDPQGLRLATDYYQQAISAAAEVYESLIQKELTYDQETLNRADTLYQQGLEQQETGNCDQAIPLLTRARELYHSIEFGSGEIRTLVIMARCQLESGDFFNALLNLLDGLQIASELPLGTPTTELYLQGQDQYEHGQWSEAKATFEDVREQYRQANNLVGVAQVTLDLGNVYAVLGDYPQAETLYQEALPMFIDQDDRYNQGAARHNLANLASITGRYAEARDSYEIALEIWASLGKPVEEVYSLSGLGLALNYQGNYAEALATLQKAQTLQQRLSPDPEIEGDLLNNIGLVYLSLGDYQTTLDFFNQALTLRRELPHRQKEIESLNNIASVQAKLGRFDEALTIYQQVIEQARDSGSSLLEAKTNVNIASVYVQQGDFQSGIATFQRALPVIEANNDRPSAAGIHQNLGAAYIQLGDLDEGLDHLNQALGLFKQIGNIEGVATSQANLGLRAVQSGDSNEAEAYLEQALATWREVGNTTAESQILGNLALVAASRGDFHTALTKGQEALRLSEQTGNPVDISRLLIIVGGTHLALSEPEVALEYSQQASELAQQIGDPMAEMGGYLLLAAGHYAKGELAQAYDHVKLAIDHLEILQGSITVAELKTTFLGRLVNAYDLAIITAVELGRPEEAFQYAEQARARAFLDQLTQGRINYRASAEPALLKKEQAVRNEIAALRDQLVTLRSRPRSEWDNDTIKRVETELIALETEYARLLTELKIQSPEAASLVSGEIASLADIQNLLDPEATLVEYYILEDRTLAFIVTPTSFDLVTLEVDREQLAEVIAAFRDFATVNDTHPRELQQLHQWLIDPLKSHLQTPSIGFVPHNVLHYLPFAAITDGQRFLNDDYVLFTLPSASTLRFIQTRHPALPATILALGNSAIEEPGLPSLPFAEQEVNSVADLFDTQALVGEAATESAVWAKAGEMSVLHLAAHGTLNVTNPLFSTIHLVADNKNDGRLEVFEVYGLDLTNSTDLVVLSACETQLGKLSAGDEFVGLNRAFLFTGTPSVIASLWNVDDEVTSVLMKQFYTHLRNGLGKAEALRQAQLEVRAEYPNPYYWAAFVLSGSGG